MKMSGSELESVLIWHAQHGGDEGTGCTEARRRLIEAHYGLIWMRTAAALRVKFHGGAPPHLVEEFIAIGVEWFCKAVRLFNPSLGWTLLTYAGVSVQRGVIRALVTETGVVRVPMHNQKYKCPEFQQLARRARNPRQLHTSLRAKDGPDIDGAIDQDERLTLVHAAMRRLDAKRRGVLLARASGRTLVEIGEELGVTRERIRQIERESLDALREELGADERMLGLAMKQAVGLRRDAPVGRMGGQRGTNTRSAPWRRR